MSKTLTFIVDATIDADITTPEQVEARLDESLSYMPGVAATYVKYIGEIQDLDPIIHEGGVS